MMAESHASNRPNAGIEPMPLMRPLSSPQMDTPPYDTREDSQKTRYKGSSYVAIDSWAYPALDRLIAVGYIQTGSLAIRPNTRMECARLLAAAHVLATDEDPLEDSSGVGSLLLAIDREFAHEAHVVDGEPTQAVPSKVSMRAPTGSPALVARIREGNGLG